MTSSGDLVFWGDFWAGLEGFSEIDNATAEYYRSYAPDIAAFLEASKELPRETLVCTGKIRHKGSTYIDAFNYLKSLVPQDMVPKLKVTMAAPNWYHLRYREGKAYSKDVYNSDEEYFADIAKAYQEEFSILYEAGLRNVQIDDPNLACTFPSRTQPSAYGFISSSG